MDRKFGIGLDIGIGSVGWAVISWTNNIDARIENCGVRLFDSGEIPKTKERKNQERRRFRSVRRLIRRRRHRKDRAKRFMQKIGLITEIGLKEWQEKNGNQNVFLTRFKGLSEKLTPEEIADCVIHICNHRGYREFYEEEEADAKEQGKIKGGLASFEEKYNAGKYSSVAEMILKDEAFRTSTAFPDYHNHKDDGAENYMLIKREYLKKELTDILKYQQQYYKQLNDKNIEFLVENIVFAQRDFETGPGAEGDKTRRFMGFLDSLGQCMFYKDEIRAFRSTVIADIYSLVNCLSQMSFVNASTGEIVLPNDVANEIIRFAMDNAGIKESDINRIVKAAGLEIHKSEKLKIPETVKTLKILKNTLEDCGYKYNDLISEEQFDLEKPSKLALLCKILNSNITPKRRISQLKKAGWNEKLQAAMTRKKFGGTASVCEKYMIEAIHAFLNGETYGNFQARRLQDRYEKLPVGKKKLIPPFTKAEDADIVENAVVFKAINETRKVINAIIRKYGSPSYMNIEVADDLGHSLEERKRMEKSNRDNEKKRNDIKEKLVELGLRKEGEVSSGDVLRYNLWKQQDGKDLYSGEPIAENEILSYKYDVDHIVPFSLILDDTMNNKALVNMGANRQEKGQKVPREYLQGKQLDTFLKNVNMLFKSKKISEKKYRYLMLPNLNDNDLLDEWKSRNINDTRYITKYIVNYISQNLQFDSDKAKNVFAVKGAITSKMRRRWLDDPWGSEEKSRDNNLHHAADAIVIANLTPAYIEIASDSIKLQSIFYSNRKRVNDEYLEYLNRSIRKMKKYYGFDEDYAKNLLASKKRIPAMVRGLNIEANLRLMDPSLERYAGADTQVFISQAKALYNDDAFVESISMPLVSYKQEKKYKGAMTTEMPKKMKELEQGYYIKTDERGNDTALDAKKYYCIEIYKDVKGNNALRGLRYVDFVKQNKKLMLVVDYPEDYKEHVMYLFSNDYIVIKDSKLNCKVEGFFKGVKAITRNSLYFKSRNNSESVIVGISRKDYIKKYSVDILGNLGGEIKCSAPYTLPKVKK